MPASKKKASRKAAPKRPESKADKLHIKKVRDLVRLMVENDLTSLEIINGGLKVSLGRGGVATASEVAGAASSEAPDDAPGEVEAGDADGLVEVTSPMVGTFYAAPSPDSEPFVDVGTRVTAELVVCLIEAMKVMNEIKAECAGTVVELVALNGQPVEYGQVLFRVKP